MWSTKNDQSALHYVFESYSIRAEVGHQANVKFREVFSKWMKIRYRRQKTQGNKILTRIKCSGQT